MMPELKLKDLSYIIMIVVILVSAVMMTLEKLDICFGLIIFMVSLLTGMFYLLFIDSD